MTSINPTLNREIPNIETSKLVLRFRNALHDSADYIVLCGQSGLELFRCSEESTDYKKQQIKYVGELYLCDCQNLDDIRHLLMPCGYTIDEYIRFGYHNLAYAYMLHKHPILRDYFDSPGLLSLIIDNYNVNEHLLAPGVSRKTLLQRILKNRGISKAQTGWLKKVRPGKHYPLVVTKLLRQSIMRIEYYDDDVRIQKLKKLFSHQKRWTVEGLELAYGLLENDSIDPGAISSLLDIRNDVNNRRNGVLNEAKTVLKTLLAWEDLPPIIVQRIHDVNQGSYLLTQGLARRLVNSYLRYIHRNNADSRYQLLLSLLDENDIPPPILPGNALVRHLGTLKDIRRQALAAGNCLWTEDVLIPVLQKEVDLYAMETEGLYTISICRESLEITNIELSKHCLIEEEDNQPILDWYTTAKSSQTMYDMVSY